MPLALLSLLCLFPGQDNPPLGAPERALSGLQGWAAENLTQRLGETPLGPLPVEAWPRSFDPAAFESQRPFERWAELLRAAGTAEQTPALEAERCLLMLAQGRFDDAWRALADLEAPGAAAALWPRFLPGLPAGPEAWKLELAPGGTLRPALPPPVDPDPRVLLEPRRAEVRGLQVGSSVVDLRFDLRLEGFEVAAELRSGPAVEFWCVLPCPPGFERFAEYADWVRQDPPGSPLPIRLTPGAEPWRLWSRFLQTPQRFPGELPDLSQGLPARVERAGLCLVLAAGTPESRCLAGLAPALEGLFAAPVSIAFDGAAPTAGDPVRLRLLPGPELPFKLARLLSLAEQGYLATTGR